MSPVTLRVMAGVASIGVLATPRIASAQTSADQFAKAYAPMYWFAIDEPLYPTLPHPFAFDGVALRTATAPCRLELDKGGKPDFFNATELNLDETCDRVALKRRFRPLIQGASADDGLGPHPRMRILFDGPSYFSGGLDITARKDVVCSPGGKVNLLVQDLRKYRAIPETYTGGTGDGSFKDIKADTASGLCSGTFTDRDLGVNRPADEPALEFRVRPVWDDTCRKRFVRKLPAKGCRADKPGDQPRLMVFSGNKVLDAEEGVVLKPRYLIQYWAYFPYDRGINGHRHDGEHVFIFIEGEHDSGPSLESPVVAIVGGGHEEDAANNILVAGSLNADASVIDQINFPEMLPRHAMVLVELGKHASAPDRNLNGRFDIGVDANLWGENAWGSRDTQSALFGKAQLGKMQPWYSMPRSSDGIFTEDGAWEGGRTTLDPKDYGFGYPQGLFDEFAARVNPAIPPAQCDFGRVRTYRLMPISILKDLSTRIRAAAKDPKDGWARVWTFLNSNRNRFWETGCDTGLPDSPDPELGGNIMAQLNGWIDTETEKRDVWLHRKFVKPDSVFKTHLFPRVSFGWSLRSFSGVRQQLLVAQVADLFETRALHDSTFELAFANPVSGVSLSRLSRANWDPRSLSGQNPLRHVSVTVESFRGRSRGWYTGASTDSDHVSRRRWHFRAGYGLQFASLATTPIVGSVLQKIKPLSPLWQRTRVAFRFGGRGLLGGGEARNGELLASERRGFAFEWSLNLTFALMQSKHPLKFFSDVGSKPNEEGRR